MGKVAGQRVHFIYVTGMVGKEPKKRSTSATNLIIRLITSFLVIWVCAQIYFLSVTGKEGQGKKDDDLADPRIEQALIKDVSDALRANAVSGVNEAGILEARKALLDYYLRTNDTVKAEIEGRHSRDDAIKATSITSEQKMTALSEVAAAMRDIGRFQLAEEIYTQLVKDLRARADDDGGTDADDVKLAAQLNNLGVTYFLWSQTFVEPKSRREKFALAQKQNALCKEVLSESKTTDGNGVEKENLLTTVKANEHIYEMEISYGGP